MQAFVTRARSFLRDEDGPTATEYAVMLAMIIIAALAGIRLLGFTVSGMFERVADEGLNPEGGGGE